MTVELLGRLFLTGGLVTIPFIVLLLHDLDNPWYRLGFGIGCLMLWVSALMAVWL